MADTTTLTGFHVSRDARDFYKFAQDYFAYRGKAQIPNFQTARGFANQMNQRRDIASDPSQIVQASAVNAVALIQGIQHYLFRAYCQSRPGLLEQALSQVQGQLGGAAVTTLDQFVAQFPPQPVYAGAQRPYDYILAMYDGRPNRETTLEELLMLWLSNANPAFRPFFEIFGDGALRQNTAYPQLTEALNKFFGQVARTDAGDGQFPAGENILELLLAPVRAAPDSLETQLQLLLNTWSGALDQSIITRMLTVMDTLKEDYRFTFGGGGAPTDFVSGHDMVVLSAREMAQMAGAIGVDGAAPEPEAFTLDRAWMPNLVLMAKNAYVWLDQLSKKYGRELMRLDQIPDAELDQLAKWGFTGLWLIGLWERSEASKRIKHMSGNPDAVASAYSLWDYQIAQRLGGEDALTDLRTRAWKRGIRLASDMVPNHVGIDGKWVLEHPDYFVALDYSPYPNYTFNGTDLSINPNIGIYLEDHYYDKTDAAVVFKRIDRQTGREQYLYHGNDGTTMPWNDTAQLDYLNPDVREAMIQLIIDIAKRFPVIRFDAAMTLVKRHVHRLWWPEPGTGAVGVSSRAQFGMGKAQFDALMPEEFWREVVDRCAVEAPDTLLLAEAFWMMESYFVRTLGMHRVYNSAYMNMVRDEENAKYRVLMQSTLEFDPEILRRYVNFLNNPDEKTAVEQFGKGDKYFGVAMLMLTMPGLPMFGHGQVEGFSEKYGMEYYRAYYDETPDQWLIERHERELFPVMKRRALFAGVEHFLLYEFETSSGLDETVYAYSNRKGDERTLIVYNNQYANVAGWVRTSVQYSVKIEGSDERTLIRSTLGDGLALPVEDDMYVTFRDHRSGLDYLRNARELIDHGLYVELGAYQYVLFWDFRIVRDSTGHYGNLANSLNGRGVPNLYEALQEQVIAPILQPFRALLTSETLAALYTHRTNPTAALLPDIQDRIEAVVTAVEAFTGHAEPTSVDESPAPLPDPLPIDSPAPTAALLSPSPLAERGSGDEVDSPLSLSSLEGEVDPEPTQADHTRETLEKVLMLPLQETPKAFAALFEDADTDKPLQGGLITWALLGAFGDDAAQTRGWIDEWLLGKVITGAIREFAGLDEYQAGRVLTAIRLASARQTLLTGTATEDADELLYALLGDTDARQVLGVNQFEGITYYDKQGFETLLRWLILTAQVNATPEALESRYQSVKALLNADSDADYQVNKLRDGLRKAKARVAAV